MRLLRASGSVDLTRYRCEHRFCDHCADRYAGRVATAIAETIEATDGADDDDGPYMLTLTHPHHQPHSSERQRIACAWRRLRDHWRETVDLAKKYLRWRRHLPDHRRRMRRGRRRAYWSWLVDETESKLRARGLERYESTDPDRTYSETWSEGGSWSGYELPEGEGDEISYLWAREITRGEAPTHSDHDRCWHAHQHVLLPDRATAEILNAAWQQTQPGRTMCQTDIRSAAEACEEPDADLEGAGDYLAMYVSGSREGAHMADPCGECSGCEEGRSCDEPIDWSTEVSRAYVEGLQGETLYGAAGEYRPIGVADRPDPDDPTIAVGWADLDRWETWAEFWGEESTVRSAMTIGAPIGDLGVPAPIAEERPDSIDPDVRAVLQGAENIEQAILEWDRNISDAPPAVGGRELSRRIDAACKRARVASSAWLAWRRGEPIESPAHESIETPHAASQRHRCSGLPPAAGGRMCADSI